MKDRARIFLIVILQMLLMGGLFAYPRQSQAAQTVTVGFIGDSITMGYGAASPVYAEARALQDKGITMIPVNQAISGTTTTDWLPNGGTFISALSSFKSKGASVVSIMLGTNDGKTTVNTTPAQYKANIQAIAAALLAPGTGITTVILNYGPYVNEAVSSFGIVDSALQLYWPQLDTLVNNTTILQGDTQAFSYFQNHAERLYDGVHPDDQGTTALGGLWATALYPILTNVPLISEQAKTDVGQTTATLHWTTQIPTTGKALYGPTAQRGLETSLDTLGSSHSAVLTQLIPCRRYHYEITAIDGSSHSVASADSSFDTLCPATTIVKSVEKTIDPSVGGTVSLQSSDKDSLVLSAGQGFESAGVSFQLNQVSAGQAALPAGVALIGPNIYDITSVKSDGTLRSEYGQPFVVSMKFDPASVTGSMDWQKISVLHNHNNSGWEPLTGCTMQKLVYTVSCPVSEFSSFALVYSVDAGQVLTQSTLSTTPAASATPQLARTGTFSLPVQMVGMVLLLAGFVLRKRKLLF